MNEKISRDVYQAYVKILQEELVPAMGCTEPIALAYASALARRELGCLPQMVTVAVSANIIKNVKSVVGFPIPADCVAFRPPWRPVP